LELNPDYYQKIIVFALKIKFELFIIVKILDGKLSIQVNILYYEIQINKLNIHNFIKYNY